MKNVLLIAALCSGLDGAALYAGNYAGSLQIELAPGLPNYKKSQWLPAIADDDRSGYASFVLGDFNNDTRLDAVLLDGKRGGGELGIVSLIQQPDGSFDRAQAMLLGTFEYTWHMLTGDFDEDGNIDIIVDERRNDLLLLRGKGDGTFEEPRYLDVLTPMQPVIIDINKDGHLDIVGGSSPGGEVVVSLGDGKGSFSPQAPLGSRLIEGPSQMGQGQIMPADFNQDGEIDLLVASPGDRDTSVGTLELLLGNGDGTFRAQILTENVAGMRGVIGDWTGDGITDYAGLREQPLQLQVWLGTRDGHFTRGRSYPLEHSPVRLFVNDLNVDGMLDLIVSGEGAANAGFSAPLAIFLGKGDGSFQTRVNFEPMPGYTVVNVGPRFADVDGDGYVDIVSPAVLRPGSGYTAVALHPGMNNLTSRTRFKLNMITEAAKPLVIEATQDFVTWTPFSTNNAPLSTWSVLDTPAAAQFRFYRTRQR